MIKSYIALTLPDAYHLLHGKFAGDSSKIYSSPIRSAPVALINGKKYILLNSLLGLTLKNEYDRMFTLATVNRRLGNLGSTDCCYLVKDDIAYNLNGGIKIERVIK